MIAIKKITLKHMYVCKFTIIERARAKRYLKSHKSLQITGHVNVCMYVHFYFIFFLCFTRISI